MKRTKLAAVIVIIAALFAAKAVFPEFAESMIQKADAVFSRDIDYLEVFGGIGDSVSVFKEKNPDDSGVNTGKTEYEAVSIEHFGIAEGELGLELAVNTGESGSVEAEKIPDAVAAFLESQSAYAEYELPEKASYDYVPFPGDYAIPVSGYNSSGFGYRLHPIKGEVRFHYGTDFAAWTGEPVLAFAEGTVSFAGYSDSYGNYITIDHADGWTSLYAHCSKLCVETGDSVSAGDEIALVGETGLATGPHLHFELKKDGVYVNPEYYVN